MRNETLWRFWNRNRPAVSEFEKRLALIEERLEGQAVRLLRYERAQEATDRALVDRLQMFQDDIQYLNRVEWLASGRPLSCQATLDLPESLLVLFEEDDD